jgi:hypothetical protein
MSSHISVHLARKVRGYANDWARGRKSLVSLKLASPWPVDGDDPRHFICQNRLEVWYNLTMAEILDNSALDRLFEPLAQCFTRDVAKRVADLRADASLQARIDELAAKANEGELTGAEDAEYKAYVEGIDMIGILQAKARAMLRHSSA